MAVRLQHDRRHGAVPLAENRTAFALWAPDARSVALATPDAAPVPMPRDDDGWYRLEAPLPAGTRYRYLIDDELEVPDPASRAQADDVHGYSQVVDHSAFSWQHADWQGRPWRETVLYELHPGLLGGFAGVQRELPRLAELGVTAIELMPIGEFPGARNWGYDGVLPYAPEAAYGSPDDLKRLIDAAHGLGLMVFLDVVYNHFGPDGNYLGRYASAFFDHQRQTPWGDGIDFSREEVRRFFIDNARMWLLDYRFDGLRLDAVHAIPDRSFLTQLAREVRAEVPSGRQVHLVLENEDNAASLLEAGFDAQWNDDGHNVLHVLLTGESQGYYRDYQETPTQKLARLLGEGFIYQGQLNRRGEPRGEPSGHLPASAFVLFLQNHDQTGNRAFGERLVQLADADALRAASALLLLSPMVPMLFMGEEWGAREPFLFFTDHHGELAEAVREGRRNEFAEFAEFNDPEQRQRIPDPNATATFEASRPSLADCDRAPHAQWLAYHRQLLKLRREQILPYLGEARPLGAEVLGDGAVRARWQLAGRRLRIELNLGADAVQAGPVQGLELLFASAEAHPQRAEGWLPGRCALVFSEEAA